MSQFSYDSFVVESDRFVFTFSVEGTEHDRQFVHQITFNSFQLESVADPVLQHFAFYIGMTLIPYYYTLQFADSLVIQAAQMPDKAIQFFQDYYEKGLAELMYRNGIDLNTFPTIKNTGQLPLPNLGAQATSRPVSSTYLVSHGGGKDSIISGELLDKAQMSYQWFVMGYDGARVEHILPSIQVSPVNQVIQVNQTPHPYRFAAEFKKETGHGFLGHKPMNAYLAFLGTCIAYIHNMAGFIISNEASASEGNIIIDGKSINHQYTKSMEFETNFRTFMQQLLPVDVQYFSLLRPLSEVAIARQFTKHPQYFQTFMSCNEGIETGVWCSDCPKCAFVYLMVYAFTNKQTAMSIFEGKDLLAEPTLSETFMELAGMSGHKPFECVGEIEEVRIFLSKIHQQGDEHSAFMLRFWQVFGSSEKQAELQQLEAVYSQLYPQHHIPQEIFAKVFQQ